MRRGSDFKNNSEIGNALFEWREALERFDSAESDEIRFVALEVEAAKRRYMFLLNKKRRETDARYSDAPQNF